MTRTPVRVYGLPPMRRPLLLLTLGLASCGERSAPPVTPIAQATTTRPATSTRPAHPLGFAVWHDDLPIEVPLSPSGPGHWYSRTPSQALEQVVKNLSGTCTQDAWHFARDFFKRAPEDGDEVLIEHMERAFLAPDRGEIVENIVDAMGAAARPVFAPSLLRAVGHSREGVRSKAMAALTRSGTRETLQAAYKNWEKLEPRCRLEWVRAAAQHLGDEIAPIYRTILESQDLVYLHREVLNQLKVLTPARVVAVVKPIFEKAPRDERVHYALMMHMKGDPTGTTVIRETMRGTQPGLKASVLEACVGTDFEWLLPEVLKASTDDDAGVRRAAAIALAPVPGDNVDKVLEILGLDRDDQVRRAALFALKKRGQRKLLDELVTAIPTATGSRFRTLLEDVSAAADGAAIPAIMGRYEQIKVQSPPDARDLLRIVAFMRAPEAFEPLSNVFLGPIYAFDPAGRLNSRDYLGTLLANLGGEEPRVLALFDALPRSDPARRAVLLHTLGNMATHAVRENAALVYARYRALLADRGEEPQIRLLALAYLRKDMRLDDMQKLKKMLEGEDEAMRRALNNFLFEFF